MTGNKEFSVTCQLGLMKLHLMTCVSVRGLASPLKTNHKKMMKGDYNYQGHARMFSIVNTNIKLQY